MLIITRRAGQKIRVGDDVCIEVLEVSGSTVRVGIAAPRSIPVYREEIWTAVAAENAAATQARPAPGNGGPGAISGRREWPAPPRPPSG